MNNILLVEDDQALNFGIKMALENLRLKVTSCILIREAREAIRREEPDLVLLDINLPDGDGLGFLREIKEKRDIPVILLTAKDMETDIVAGLASGADDYVTKPFSLAVLRARADVQLRKKKSRPICRIGEYSFDFDRQVYEKEGERIELSQTEQKILKLLVSYKGGNVPREQLESYVWGDGFRWVDSNTLSVAVKRLRGKLGDTKYIKTVYGIGYTWKEEPDG